MNKAISSDDLDVDLERVMGRTHPDETGERTRVLAGLTLLGSDGAALALVVTLAHLAQSAAGADPMLPRLLLFAGGILIGLKAAQSLYPGFGLHPAARLRKRGLAFAGSGAIGSMAALTFMAVDAATLVALWLGLAGVLACQAVAGFWVRRRLIVRGAWGLPVGLCGNPAKAAALGRYLGAHPDLGLRPVAEGKPCRVQLWAGDTLPDGAKLAAMREAHAEVILVSDLPRLRLSGVHPSDHGDHIGLRLVPPRHTPLRASVKRGFDLALTLPLVVLTAPVVLFAAAAIRMVDPGPAFYVQQREGQDGKPIGVLKLRTMYLDADRMLAELLERDPEARAEWESHFKLQDDPRVLPGIGTFLRVSSLDELPQLLNILRGDMSLVGPRPFPAYHLAAMPSDFRHRRASVVPGLTGLWQISERSTSDLEGQQELDEFYIDGRSFWGDLAIFLGTFWAVLDRRGAY